MNRDGVYKWDNARPHATSGVRPSRWRDQEATHSNRRASFVSVVVHHGLLVANMVELHNPLVEDHHEGVLHAACGR